MEHESRAGLWGVLVCSSNGGGLLGKASAEVIWEVCGNVFCWDLCGPRGLSVGKEEQAGGGYKARDLAGVVKRNL
jgi:hypothetical protein